MLCRIIILALLVSYIFADNYEVTVKVRTARTIQACVLGKPDNEFVRLCINHKRYFLRYEKNIGYGWELDKSFALDNPLSKCSCKSLDALQVTKAGEIVIKEETKYTRVESTPKGYIKISKPTDLTKLPKKDKLNTSIICVKCGE